MSIRLSIILSAYSSDAVLDVCLGSLAMLPPEEFEIIAVENESNDRWASAIRHGITISHRFRVVAKEAGLTAWQNGLAHASGEFVTFLRADSVVFKDAYQHLLRVAAETQSDVVIGEAVLPPMAAAFEENDSHGESLCLTVSGKEALRKTLYLARAPFFLDFRLDNRIFRRSLVATEGILWPDTSSPHDWMSFPLMAVASRVAIVNIKLVVTQREDIALSGISDKAELETLPVLVTHLWNVLERLHLHDDFGDLFVRYFGYVLFQLGTRYCMAQPLEDGARISLAQQWMNQLFDDSLTRRLVLAYLSLPEQRDNRLIWASIQNHCANPSLSADRQYRGQRREGGRGISTSTPACQAMRSTTRSMGGLVSVITVLKDTLKTGRRLHFEKMLSTVAAQDYPREWIEHIVIDSASNDGTVAYLKQLSEAGKVDYWMSEPDSGIYNAMNKGAAFALGDYVLYLNSDDYLAPNAISSLVSAIETENCDYAYADAQFMDENEQVLGEQRGNMNTVFFGSPYCHQTLLCKRTCFDSLQYDERFRITMWKYAIDLFLSNYRGTYVKGHLAFFRVGGVSTGADSAQRFFEEQDRIRRNVILPQLRMTYDEYMYIDTAFRGQDIERFYHHNAEELCGRLKLMSASDNSFESMFGRFALNLVTCVWDETTGQYVLQSLLRNNPDEC